MPKGEETIPDHWAMEAAARCVLDGLYQAGFHQPAIAHALRAARAKGYAEATADIRKLLEDAASDAEQRSAGAAGLMKEWLTAMGRVLRSCIKGIDAGQHVGIAEKGGGDHG